MSLYSYNDFIARVASGYSATQPVWGEINTATTATFLANNLMSYQKVGLTKTFPALPSGVTSYIVTSFNLSSSTAGIVFMFAKLINLGSLDIAGPTFNDGNQMPTVTELGVSTQLASPVLVECTTTLGGTAGSLQITYVDQDGNTAESNTAQAMTNSTVARSVAWAILNTGDWGVRDITNATRTGGAAPTGVVKFWGIIPYCIGSTGNTTVGATPTEDFLTSGQNLMNHAPSDELGVFMFSTTSTKGVFGNIFVVGDN
jgi:hypothetical protein